MAATMLSVYDALGRLVHQEPATAQNMGIFTAHWTPGTYFVTWISPGSPPRYATAIKVE
jgi:hypothetical protein